MYKLVLIRHGQSVWNLEKRFTGWTDVAMTEKGKSEARNAGKLLKKHGFVFDQAYTSLISRAVLTLWLALEEMELSWIPVEKDWRLNERHYGALQGCTHKEKNDEVGTDQVFVWRRSFDTRPPALALEDERHPSHDERYAHLSAEQLPAAECLKDTLARTQPYLVDTILPAVKSGKNVILSAHGNSLRAIVKYLEKISDEDITGLNIPTGTPLVYELDKDLNVMKKYYLEA